MFSFVNAVSHIALIQLIFTLSCGSAGSLLLLNTTRATPLEKNVYNVF
jgi:hypothetical protein